METCVFFNEACQVSIVYSTISGSFRIRILPANFYFFIRNFLKKINWNKKNVGEDPAIFVGEALLKPHFCWWGDFDASFLFVRRLWSLIFVGQAPLTPHFRWWGAFDAPFLLVRRLWSLIFVGEAPLTPHFCWSGAFDASFLFLAFNFQICFPIS